MADVFPKVSGILPVGYGDRFFRVAAAAFLASTYAGELELIILDNSDDPIESLVPDDPRIKYFRCDRLPVGALRNLGTSYSSGDICMTIDEDDWSGIDRVAQQVERLQSTGRAVTGFHALLYYDMATGATFKYHFEPNRPHPPYACGSSQCYARTWWEEHKFPATGIEDWGFAQEALNADQLDSIDGAQLLIARAHNTSTCYPTQLGSHRQFPAVPKQDLPAEFYLAIAPKAIAKPKSSKAIGE